MKCPDCGLEFDSSQQECPNCGCPANECELLSISEDEYNGVTTDTGYQQEKTIKSYADAIWYTSIGAAALLALVTVLLLFSEVLSVVRSSRGGVDFSIIIIGVIMVSSVLAFGIIVKAFLYVYANISINIHEINMKIK